MTTTLMTMIIFPAATTHFLRHNRYFVDMRTAHILMATVIIMSATIILVVVTNILQTTNIFITTNILIMTTENIFFCNGSREYLPDYNGNNYHDNDRYVNSIAYFYQNGGYFFLIILLILTAANILINAATQVLTQCILLMTSVATYQSIMLMYILMHMLSFVPPTNILTPYILLTTVVKNISTTVAIKIITMTATTLVKTQRNIFI